MKPTVLPTLTVASLLFACHNPEPNVTIRDKRGNYVTTSDFQKMERTEFVAALRAGLEDFDEQVADLRARANELGGDRLQAFADCAEDLKEERIAVVNELERTDAAMVEDWPDRRRETLQAYYELREQLDDAFKDVLDA